MSNPTAYHPITAERHGKKRWQRYTSYEFARRHSLLPIAGAELGAVAHAFTIAFVPHGDGFVPVAVLGLESGKGLYVSADGRWLGRYIPAVLRSHPFAELPMDDGRLVLCVDEASGLLSEIDGPLGGESFFNADGSLSASIQSVLGFLQDMAATRPRLMAATATLNAKGVLKPWEAKVQIGTAHVKVEGLYWVDEAALNALSDADFLELRRSGALPLAYTHLLSTQNLQMLGTLAQSHAEAAQAQQDAQKAALPAGGELDLSFMESDTLRFT